MAGIVIDGIMRTPEDSDTDPDNLIRLGTVASVDLATKRCTVKLDDGAETVPVRWLEFRMGDVRTHFPPAIGEEAILLCPGGEIGSGVALLGLGNDQFPSPGEGPVPLIQFADGAIFSYDQDAHAALLTLPDGGRLDISADVNITGTLTASVDVVGGGKSLKGHKHGGVQAGGAQTGAPV